MLNVLGIDNILHAVGNLEEASDFYGGKLGLALKFAVPEAGIALYRLGNETPGLLLRTQDPAPPRAWLEVPDAMVAARLLGSEPREINTGWVVEIEDPWGNVIGLTDYSRRPELSRRTTTDR